MKRALWMMKELIESSPKGLTREELNRKWSVSTFNEKGEETINERTFYRLRDDLQEIFQIDILCSKDGNKRYYIEHTEYSDFIGMFCRLVTDNSKNSIAIKDLMLNVMNGMAVTDEERDMIDGMAFRLNRVGYECGEQLIAAARNGEIKGADHAQWANMKYHLFIWLDETYLRTKSTIGVGIYPRKGKNRGEIRLYVVNETQDQDQYARMMETLDLYPGEKREEGYWWFAPKDDSLHLLSYTTYPDVSTLRSNIEILLSRLNAF